MDKEPITIQGLENLKKELKFLKEQKRPEIVTAIAIHINVLVVVVNNFLLVLTSSIVILNLLIGIFIVDVYIASFSIFIFSYL